MTEFKDWYDAVWLGDQENGQEVPTNPGHPKFKEYMDGYTLALGAWKAARAPLLARIADLEFEVSCAEFAANAAKVDAERYRWLRLQSWQASQICCVANPKKAVKIGHDCPSLSRLDAAIDAAIRGKE